MDKTNEQLKVASRRLVSSAIRKFVYATKAKSEPGTYDRLVGIEEQFFEAVYNEWLHQANALGRGHDESWRETLLTYLKESQTEALHTVGWMFEGLEIAATKEVADFVELFDYTTLLPRGES
jgi:hypothetical protein